MEITIKIKLDSGKELELTEDEYKELQMKVGSVIKEPYYIPYVSDPWPNYPMPCYPNHQPWITWCSSDINSSFDDLK